MSKGIGAGYLNRMKKYHLCRSIRSPTERISSICDRSFYHDGSFKYKLPRFYRDRLFRKKFPCDAKIWNNKKQCYENKIVYRYKSKNILALQIQIEVRNRFLAEYNRKFSEFRRLYPDKSDSEIDIILERSQVTARQVRRYDISTKMSRFYNYNRFKYPKL